MNVLETHERIVEDYASYIRSFLNITDEGIRKEVEANLSQGRLWPAPLLQFNPAYQSAGTVEGIVVAEKLHPSLKDIFKGYFLYLFAINLMRFALAPQEETSSSHPARASENR